MILIIGNNHDDVLYFESVAKDVKEEVILNKYHAIVGSIFNQNVLILKDVYTSYLSTGLCMYLIEKYHILMVFNVGKCRALTPDLRTGDIVISNKIVFGDVDQSAVVKGTKVAQIPGFEVAYYTNNQLLSILRSCLDRVGKGRHFEATYLSSSVYKLDFTEVDRFLAMLEATGDTTEVVVDGEIAGVALASTLMDIPCIGIKVIESKTAEQPTVDTYLRVLKSYSALGKAIVSAIGEIGRNDVLR